MAVNVTGLPVRPVAVAVTVFVPATVPSVHEVSVAIPLAFVTTGVAVTGTMLPPPAVTAKVTATPATGLLSASRTSTDGATATGSPTVSDWVVSEFDVICDAAPAVPVAVNVTGLPVRPVAVAVTVFAPATVPSVHEVSVAIPLAFVTTGVAVTGTMLPPPAVTVKVTATPATGLLSASRTSTEGGAATAVFTGAVCVVTEFAPICVAAPARPVAVKVTGLPVRPVAVAVTVFAPADGAQRPRGERRDPAGVRHDRRAVTGTMLPPPAVTVNVTATPATGLLFASRTSTDGGAATGSPTVSLCEVSELAAICDAAPALTLNGLLVAPLRPVDAAVSE